MSDKDPQSENDQLWTVIDENAARIRDLVAELEQAYGTIEALSSLLRLLLERLRLGGTREELKSLADQIEAELLAVLHRNRVN